MKRIEDNRVGVIGGGIAGLETALKLERKGLDVTLYDPEDSLLFYPSSHNVLEGSDPEKVSISFEEKFESRNITHEKNKVDKIEPSSKTLTAGYEDHKFDYLVLACGAENAYQDIDKANTKSLRSIEDLSEVRGNIKTDNVNKISVIGGGATGVEASSSLNFARNKSGSNFDIRIFHSGERLLDKRSKKLSDKVESRFESEKIKIEFDTSVKEIYKDKIETADGRKFKTDEIIWAGGIKKHSLIENTEIPQDRKGVKVDGYQRVEGFKDIYAVGDCASYDGSQARALYALFESKAAAKNIVRSLSDRKLKKRKIRYDPIIIYLGNKFAALEHGGFVFTGRIPSLMDKIGVEKRYLWTRKYLM